MALFNRLSTREKSRFFYQLAALLKTGISVERSISMAGNDCHSSFQSYLKKVSAALLLGQDLASAMAREGGYFDNWTISLIRLAEYSGSLEETCRRLASSFEVQQRRERLYRSVNLAAIATIFSLLLWVNAIFQRDLFFLAQPSFWLKSIGIGLLFLSIWIFASYYSSIKLQQWLGKVPGFGNIQKVRSLLYLSELQFPLSCGISTLAALELLQEHMPDPIMRKNVAIAIRSIRLGHPLSNSLQGKIPPLAVQLIRTAEETGNLDAAFHKLGEYYEQDLERSLHLLEGIFKPLSILALGSIVLLLGIRTISSLINSLPG